MDAFPINIGSNQPHLAAGQRSVNGVVDGWRRGDEESGLCFRSGFPGKTIRKRSGIVVIKENVNVFMCKWFISRVFLMCVCLSIHGHALSP